jgi:hypothetical protein
MRKYLNLIVVLGVIAPLAASADTVSLPPTDDACVSEISPTSNYGGLSYLLVGYTALRGGRLNTLIKFDLSGYADATINSAYIRLRVYNSWGDFPTDEIYVVRNDADWDEDTVTWDNKPGFDGPSLGLPAPGELDWWEVYVTDFVQGIVDGTYDNYGFQIYKNDPDFAGFYMYSKESIAFNPTLELDYTPTAVESASLGRVKAAFK